MITIKEAMELAGKNLAANLLAENDYLPIWCTEIKPDLTITIKNFWFSHNIGRWWDAMLRLEAATGFHIPAEAETAMLGHLQNCLNNTLGICNYIHGRVQPQQWEQKTGSFDSHSQREILLALSALIKYRRNEWAVEAGSRMVQSLDRSILPDGQWDGTTVGFNIGRDDAKDPRLVSSHGRMIEGLLEFYSSTGDLKALSLADRLAHFHFSVTTRPDGACVERQYFSGLHTHSLFGTYRGLLLYGIITRQAEFVRRIAQTYHMNVQQQVKLSGFISHDWGKDTYGETTSPGDAAQLALWLGFQGYTEFLDDVERIVRARILPSQITDLLGVRFAENQTPYNLDPEALVIGAFGGMHKHPHGEKLPTTDITAADLHTLCDIYTHIVELTDIGLAVHFHLDCISSHTRVECHEDGCQRRLMIKTDTPKNVLVRIPRWVDRKTVSISANNQPVPYSMLGDYACIPNLNHGAFEVHVCMELPLKSIRECTYDTEYEFTWRGDTVQSIRPNEVFLPFYPTAG